MATFICSRKRNSSVLVKNTIMLLSAVETRQHEGLLQKKILKVLKVISKVYLSCCHAVLVQVQRTHYKISLRHWY